VRQILSPIAGKITLDPWGCHDQNTSIIKEKETVADAGVALIAAPAPVPQTAYAFAQWPHSEGAG